MMDAQAGYPGDDEPGMPLPRARVLPGTARALTGLRVHHAAFPLAAGAAMHAAGLGPGWDAITAAGATALCGTLATAARNPGIAARLHGGAVTLGAAGWAAYAAVHGAGGHVNAACLAAAGVLALPAWLRRAPGWLDRELPDEPPGWEDDGTPPAIRDMYDTWRDYVACENGPLPGTWLENPREDGDRVSADIVLKRGRQVTSEALRKWEHVASAFDEDETRVLMEPHPERRKARARLTLLSRDVLADTHEWNGSTLDMATGLSRVGTLFDGTPMLTRVFVPGSGAAHKLVAGTTGSGKSTGLFGLIADTTDPGNPVPVVNVLIDPEEGAQSLPLWAGKLKHAYLGPDRSIRALRGLDALVNQRANEMREEGLDHFDPSWERPQVNVLIEESRVLLKEHPRKDEARAIIERLVARGRKKGVAVILVALVPSLEELDSQLIRSMLRAFDVWCFRTGDSVSGGMLGLHVDPSLLPETFADGSPTYGLSYLKGHDGRQALGRSLDIPPHRKAEIADRAVECPLDASSLAAFEAAFDPPQPQAVPAASGSPVAPVADLQQAAQLRDTAAHVVLDWLARSGAEQSKAQVLVGIRPSGITSPSTVQYALRQLTGLGLVHTAGDKCPYVITEAGRQWLAANPKAA